MLLNLQMALKSLLQNRLQAMLTLSGMSIGVAMVVLVSGLGLGAQLQIEAQIESAGPTLITLTSGNFRPVGITSSGEQDSSGGEVSEGAIDGAELGYSNDMEDNAAVMQARARARAPRRNNVRSPALPLRDLELALLQNNFSDIRIAAGTLSGNVTLDTIVGKSTRIARVAGYQLGWPDIEAWSLVNGRYISEREHISGAPVMLVTSSTADRLWPGEPALEQTIELAGYSLKVVGVIEDAGDERSSIIVPAIHTPLLWAQSVLGKDTFDVIKIRTTSVAKTTSVAAAVKEALRVLRQLPDDTVDDFRIETQSVAALPSLGTDPRLARAVHSNVVGFEQAAWEEMALSLRQAGRTFTLLLSAAAAVSLLVGGIGVMNIMLVSVAARTREIGLRMAMGARVNDVMIQFMVEAVTLAALGGIVGLMLGSLGLLGAEYGLNWATAISPTMLLLAVLMAAVTGMIFGYGPARRAANLDPVVALKSE
ncbi:MAG: putative ABC transport system permease protein [Pseudohongiellaceae bacterium]|jgi:putative ABC transport system permease protein